MTEASTSSTEPRAARPLSMSQSHQDQNGAGTEGTDAPADHDGAPVPSGASPDGSDSISGSNYRKEAEAHAGGSVGHGRSGDESGKSQSTKIPAWITDHLKNKHSLKMLFRCWLVTWVAIVVMLPTKSLQTLGQAAFFVCMVTVFLPANMPVFIWLMANATLVIGALLGWAWGCAAMAAAGRARDQELYQSQIQKVIAGSGNGNTNPEATIQAAVFQAQFLDPKASAVYGVFLTIGSYTAAVLFAKSLKLRFLAIFMTIVLDILCTYGPLFPTAQYTLGEIFLLPIGVSLGISFAGMFFIFPETLSHIWQGKLSTLFKATQGFFKLHEEFLEKLGTTTDPASVLQEYSAKLRGSMSAQVALFELLDDQKGFLHMEATYSALSSKDLCSFIVPVRTFTLRTFGLLAFTNALETRASQDASMAEQDSKEEETAAAHKKTKDQPKGPVRVHETGMLTRVGRKMREAEKAQHVDIHHDLVPIMLESSRDLLAKGAAAISEITAWLDYTNDHRYLGQYTTEQHTATVGNLKQAADDLEAALEHFRDHGRLKLLEPYQAHLKWSDDANDHILDQEGARAFRLGAQSLFFTLAWCANCVEAGRELVNVTRLAHDVAIKRQRSKLWMPTGLRKIGHLLLSHKGGVAMGSLPMGDAHNNEAGQDDESSTRRRDVFDDELSDDESASSSSHATEKAGNEERKTSKQRAEDARKKELARRRHDALRDADALPPTNLFHRFGRFLAACYHFFWSPVGLFALRYTIAGLAVWIPSVATSRSAAFSYENRGIWAIIMAQLAVSLTHGEQIFSLVSRVFGTVIGALIGAAMWYISTGNGNGNPYGFGAVTAVGFLPFVFLRLFAPIQYLIATLMTFVTLILVVGYSWQDTGRLTVSVNSGIGIVVAYRRMILVLIGIAAGIIVMLFPKPPSTRTAARLNFSKLGRKKILRLYNSIIEAWAVQAAELDGPNSDAKETRVERPSLTNFRSEMYGSYEMIKNLQTQVMMAKLEVQARGKWPGDRYEQLLKTHTRMLGALGQLYAVLMDDSYTVEWRKRFAHMTALLDPSTISDICLTLSLLGQALHTGSRLPHASMFVRERALRSFGMTVAIEEKLQAQHNPAAAQPLSLSILKSRQFMTHVQGTVALMVFLGNLDETMSIVKDLVGEEPLVGYEALQKRWEQRAFLLDP